MPETRSTCPYCGVGCGVLIQHDGQRVLDVRGDPDHPANRGRLCTKGSTLALTAREAIAPGTRLLHPQLRAQRPGPWQPLGWDAALDLAAQRIADTVHTHGADAVAVYGSGQWLTEDYHAFNTLVKGVLGTHQLDTNSRLCMSSAVAGYKATLGADAPPACYDDLDHAHTLFISGSNTAWAHPILFRRIEDAKAARPGLRLIVADPRRTETAACADLHLPLQPGTDVTLCHGLLHIMLWEGWVDSAYIAAHTTGFDELKALVRDFTPAHVARVCGLPEADLHTAARWIAGLDTTADNPATTTGTFTGQDGRQRRPTLSLYCQGLNQSSHGTANNAALIHLHLATGQIGQVGAGPFSLTGQPNAMGGREVGGMANLLPGHRDLANPQHRAEVEALWGLNALGRTLAAQPGRTAVEMFQAAADGQVKLLWIACTNPAQSLPDQATVRRALERADFVIVQEAFAHTATTAHAHLLLPATTWAEKEGTVTNSERRISRVRAAVPPPVHPDHPHDGPRHDWRIARDVGQRLEALLHPAASATPATPDTPPAPAAPTPSAPSRLMAWDGPEALWNQHREATRGRDLDITGLSYATLEQHGPQQWPYPEGATQGQARLYTDGRFPTPDGKARFAVALMTPQPTSADGNTPRPALAPVAEARSAPYPFALSTGRLRDQWHGMSRTGLLGRLFGHVPEPVLLMHPQDMARRQLHTGQLVRVSSRRGSVVVPVQDSADQGLGQLFMAMHWGPECLSGRDALGQPLQGVNALTTPAFCPTSKQPELKHAAVSVAPAELPWTLLALAWLPESQAPVARQALVQRMAQFDFAVCVPFGRESNGHSDGRSGLLFRAACATPPPSALLDELGTLLGLHTPDTLRYDDARRHQRRAIRLWRDTATGTPRLDAFLLAGDTQAEGWIKTLLQDELPVQGPPHRLLLASAQAPQPLAATSPQVCTCHNVGEAAITTQLRRSPGSASERLAALQATLKCGTQCGSCLPTVKRLVATTPVDTPPAPVASAVAEGQLIAQSHIT